MLTRPNRQSLTAVSGRMAALEDGGGKLLVLSSHCRSGTISILVLLSFAWPRDTPQSITFEFAGEVSDSFEVEVDFKAVVARELCW